MNPAVVVQVPVTCYPTRAQAATMLGVAASTITRRADLGAVRSGGREHVPAGRVLQLNALYRKRITSELAQELLDFARAHNSDHAALVEAELEEFFEAHQTGAAQPREQLFSALASMLTSEQLETVRDLYEHAHGATATAMVAQPTVDE